MDRRSFLFVSGHGLSVMCLAPVAGCVSHRLREEKYDPGPYTVGDEHLVFDDGGAAFILDVARHRILRLDDSRRVEDEFGSLGTDPGELNHPIDAAVGPEHRLYVLDRGNSRVQIFARDGRLLAGFGQKLRITSQLATDDVFQTGHDIAPGVLRTHRAARHDTVGRHNRLARNFLNIGDKHRNPLGAVMFYIVRLVDSEDYAISRRHTER